MWLSIDDTLIWLAIQYNLIFKIYILKNIFIFNNLLDVDKKNIRIVYFKKFILY